MAEPLLLVPGLNCTAELFRPQIDVFSSEREVVVADNRSDDRIEAMAERALASRWGDTWRWRSSGWRPNG